MTQIDEKAMEAARNECNAPWSSYSVRDIIEAYLSALPPPAGEVGELVERLREWGTGDDGWVRIDEAAAEACEQAADALTSLSARLAEAERYAEGLAVALAARHYPEVNVWRPLSGDLIGLLTQIDNMTSGLSRTARAGGEDGWVLVPREPTQAMLNAAIDVDSFKLGNISPLGFRESPQQLFKRCYRAMIAASHAKVARDE